MFRIVEVGDGYWGPIATSRSVLVPKRLLLEQKRIVDRVNRRIKRLVTCFSNNFAAQM